MPDRQETPTSVAEQFTSWVDRMPGDFPLPGRGATGERFRALIEVASHDLSVARLVEGHVDAVAVLAELDLAPRPGARYGVWAARGSGDRVEAHPVAAGWRLVGRKSFCSGVGTVDRALVTAEAPDGYRLFDVAVDDVVRSAEPGSWAPAGMIGSASYTLCFDGTVEADAAVGGPGSYLDRAGFWFGASGVAACWFGGARGLARRVVAGVGEPGDCGLAELGQLAATVQAMHDVLAVTADAIDTDPGDTGGGARRRALVTRQLVHQGCVEVLQLTASLGGARPLCHDPEQAQRAADLYVYLSQYRSADASQLGRLALEHPSWC